MSDLDLDAIEARANAASDGPWTTRADATLIGSNLSVLVEARVKFPADAEFIAHARTDVPALVAALREARDAWEDADRIAHKALDASDDWRRRYEAARDDWRRRYEALRDGVTGLCDEAERRADPGVRLWSMPEARVKTSELRAVVARVEGDES